MANRPDFLSIGDQQIAYRQLAGASPGVMFFGGFHSDMQGTKALFLEQWCGEQGLAFVRFDYSGHGESSGDFIDGTIGRWTKDAIAVLDQVAVGPQILVGSSMGGWIALLCARARPERVAGIVGIASAPDFTEDMMWAGYEEDIRQTLRRDGVYYETSDYDDEPYPITLRLIEEGRNHLIFREPLRLNVPVRLLQGKKDIEVPWQTADRLVRHIDSPDVSVTYIEDGDHRLSDECALDELVLLIEPMINQ